MSRISKLQISIMNVVDLSNNDIVTGMYLPVWDAAYDFLPSRSTRNQTKVNNSRAFLVPHCMNPVVVVMIPPMTGSGSHSRMLADSA